MAEEGSECPPEPSIHSFSPEGRIDASKEYSFMLGLPSCFKGKVRLCGSGSLVGSLAL